MEGTTYSSSEQVAKVLIDKKSPFLRSIIINKGSKDNIQKGMAVLNDVYLVGKVIEINYSTSRVLLLSDINSKIPSTVEPGGIQSIISGDGKNKGIIQYSSKINQISDGDVVYSSGAGGLFKSGIPIGKVEKSIINSKYSINFFSDFSQLQFVKVVYFRKKDLK